MHPDWLITLTKFGRGFLWRDVVVEKFDAISRIAIEFPGDLIGRCTLNN